MLKIALLEPEIPPNTGNIMRLCANTGAALHLIEPLGFTLEEKQLRRAGLDYREFVNVQVHPDLDAFRKAVGDNRILAMSTRGRRDYTAEKFRSGDVLLFGPESRGLPVEVLEAMPPERRLRIPMLEHSRSLNLSNAVAVVLYEGLRQLGFPGME